jgi:putative component of toxin-antitoxin plasmid stabilization module
VPLSRSLGDGVFELRFALGPTARRITYRFTRDGRIILLTTFRKQRQNERAEIARARDVAKACAQTYP